MQLASHQFDRPVALAPMSGITDLPFRELCKRWGASYAVAEMLTSDVSLWSSRKSSLRMVRDGETGLRIVQIAGSEPAMLAHAARENVDQGADIIDINMGCPAKKVCRKAAGSALLADEALVARILDAVVQAVDVPVTLKFRTGPTRDSNNAVRIAQLAESCGIQALALHGRSREDAYKGSAEHNTVRAVKQAVGIPVLANGDVRSAAEAKAVLEETGADGLLIGRGAQGQPWLFQQVRRLLDDKVHVAAPCHSVQMAEILSHISHIHEFYGAEQGMRIARKHIGWYLEHWPDSGELRRSLMRCETAAEQHHHLAQGLEQMLPRLAA